MAEDDTHATISISVPRELLEALKRAAVADLRPMQDELIVLLREALAGRAGDRS